MLKATHAAAVVANAQIQANLVDAFYYFWAAYSALVCFVLYFIFIYFLFFFLMLQHNIYDRLSCLLSAVSCLPLPLLLEPRGALVVLLSNMLSNTCSAALLLWPAGNISYFGIARPAYVTQLFLGCVSELCVLRAACCERRRQQTVFSRLSTCPRHASDRQIACVRPVVRLFCVFSRSLAIELVLCLSQYQQ